MRMWHGDGPLVPPSDLEFLYSPSAAQVALMCTPCRRQSPKRVNRNQVAYPKGTNPGHIIYKKKGGHGPTTNPDKQGTGRSQRSIDQRNLSRSVSLVLSRLVNCRFTLGPRIIELAAVLPLRRHGHGGMGENPGHGDAEERRVWQGGHDHIAGALLYHTPLHL